MEPEASAPAASSSAPAKSPKLEAAKSPAAAPAKSPKLEAAKSPAAAPAKSPKMEAAKSPAAVPAKSPKLEAAKSPAAAPAKSPKMEAVKSPAAAPAKSPKLEAVNSSAAVPAKSPKLEATKSPVAAPVTSPQVMPTKSPVVAAAKSPKVEADESSLIQVAASRSPLIQAVSSPTVAAARSPLIQPAAAPAAGAPDRPEEKVKTKKEKAKAEKNGKPKKVDTPAGEAGGILKPAAASREDNLTYDLKHMAAYDIAPQPGKASEKELLDYTRDSVQLLVNHMFGLPQNRIEEGMAVQLPSEEVFRLPRQKPVPKAKAPTRWQKFMEDRNMRKRKRSKLVYDEASGDWVPRWGYRSVKKKTEAGAQGIYEVKAGEDPNSNPFERMKAEKKLQMARQKMREVRNKVEAAGGKMRASVPDLSSSGKKRGAEGLKEALRRAQISSGSRGKFDRIAPNEATNLQPKRQKFNAPVSGEKERERYLKFAGKVLSGETVDKDKAAKVGRQQAEGTKLGKQQKGKGTKGTPGSKRRSKQGGRLRGRKVKA